jgi:hypothetical protein
MPAVTDHEQREYERALLRAVRRDLAAKRLELERLEAEERELAARCGLRPGDGSDQPALFDADQTPDLFGQ